MTHEFRRTEWNALGMVNLQCLPFQTGTLRIEAAIYQAEPAEGKREARPARAKLSLYGCVEDYSPEEFRTMLQAAQVVLEKAEAELARMQRSEPPEPVLTSAPARKKRVRKSKAR